MEILTKYKCDVCGFLHDTKEKCLRCEKCHKEIKEYNPIYASYQEYPKEVELLTNDGKALVYKFDKVLWW